MLPWHIRLSKDASRTGDGSSGALMSVYEMENRRKGPTNVLGKAIEPRNVLFGLSGMSFAPQQAAFKGQNQAMHNLQRQNQLQRGYMQQQQSAPAPAGLFGNVSTNPQAQAFPQPSAPASTGGGLFRNVNADLQAQSSQQHSFIGSSLFGNANSIPQSQASQQHASNGGSLFGNVNTNVGTAFGSSSARNPSPDGNRALQDYQMQLMLLEQQKKKRLLSARQEQDALSGAGGHGDDEFSAETILPDLPTLGTQESEWNESGYVNPRETRSCSIPRTEATNPAITKLRLILTSVH